MPLALKKYFKMQDFFSSWESFRELSKVGAAPLLHVNDINSEDLTSSPSIDNFTGATEIEIVLISVVVC